MSSRVLKFGGTSLGTAAALATAIDRTATAACEGAVVAVVSAFAGVTDEIEIALARAGERDGRYRSVIGGWRERTARLLHAVADGRAAQRAEARCAERLLRLREILDAVALLRACPAELRDEALATGERLAAQVFAAGLETLGLESPAVDAAEVLRTDSSFGAGMVDAAATRAAARCVLGTSRVAVVPGFFGADRAGRTVLLGRGGSDTSATVLGAALGVDEVEIFTDVDGVLTADPRLVPETVTLSELSYADAADAAALGAKVLHARAVAPAAAAHIAVTVRNSFRDGAGSRIGGATQSWGFIVTVTRDVAAAWATASGRAWEAGPPGTATAATAVGAVGPGAAARAAELVRALGAAGIEVRALAAHAGRPLLAVVDADQAAHAAHALHAALLRRGAPPRRVHAARAAAG